MEQLCEGHAEGREEGIQTMKDFQNFLVKRYQAVYMKTDLPIISSVRTIPVQECFIHMNLRVVQPTSENHGRPRTNSISTYSQLLLSSDREICAKRVFVSGEAGMGKTTLCKKIVSTWCLSQQNEMVLGSTVPKQEIDSLYQRENVDAMSKFKYVLVLEMRHVTGENTLEDMIKSQLPLIHHQVLDTILEYEADRCLLIVDGLDEAPVLETCVRRNGAFNGVTILYTSRPWALEKVQLFLSDCDTIAIMELSSSNVKTVADTLTIWDPQLETTEMKRCTPEFVEEMDTYEFLHLSSIPMWLLNMAWLWQFKITFNGSVSQIVNSVIAVAFANQYNTREHTTCRVGRKKVHRISKIRSVSPSFQNNRISNDRILLLEKLGKFTFGLVLDERSRFDQNELIEHGLNDTDMSTCFNSGILSQPQLVLKDNNYQQHFVAFRHTLFQDYFTSLYICVNERSKYCLEQLCNKLCNTDDFQRYALLLRFICGMKPKYINYIVAHVQSIMPWEWISDEVLFAMSRVILPSIEEAVCNTKLNKSYIADNLEQICVERSKDLTVLNHIHSDKLKRIALFASDKDLMYVNIISTLQRFKGIEYFACFGIWDRSIALYIRSIASTLSQLKLSNDMFCSFGDSSKQHFQTADTVLIDMIRLSHSEVRYLLCELPVLREFALVGVQCIPDLTCGCDEKGSLNSSSCLEQIRNWNINVTEVDINTSPFSLVHVASALKLSEGRFQGCIDRRITPEISGQQFEIPFGMLRCVTDLELCALFFTHSQITDILCSIVSLVAIRLVDMICISDTKCGCLNSTESVQQRITNVEKMFIKSGFIPDTRQWLTETCGHSDVFKTLKHVTKAPNLRLVTCADIHTDDEAEKLFDLAKSSNSLTRVSLTRMPVDLHDIRDIVELKSYDKLYIHLDDITPYCLSTTENFRQWVYQNENIEVMEWIAVRNKLQVRLKVGNIETDGKHIHMKNDDCTSRQSGDSGFIQVDDDENSIMSRYAESSICFIQHIDIGDETSQGRTECDVLSLEEFDVHMRNSPCYAWPVYEFTSNHISNFSAHVRQTLFSYGLQESDDVSLLEKRLSCMVQLCLLVKTKEQESLFEKLLETEPDLKGFETTREIIKPTRLFQETQQNKMNPIILAAFVEDLDAVKTIIGTNTDKSSNLFVMVLCTAEQIPHTTYNNSSSQEIHIHYTTYGEFFDDANDLLESYAFETIHVKARYLHYLFEISKSSNESNIANALSEAMDLERYGLGHVQHKTLPAGMDVEVSNIDSQGQNIMEQSVRVRELLSRIEGMYKRSNLRPPALITFPAKLIWNNEVVACLQSIDKVVGCVDRYGAFYIYVDDKGTETDGIHEEIREAFLTHGVEPNYAIEFVSEAVKEYNRPGAKAGNGELYGTVGGFAKKQNHNHASAVAEKSDCLAEHTASKGTKHQMPGIRGKQIMKGSMTKLTTTVDAPEGPIEHGMAALLQQPRESERVLCALFSKHVAQLCTERVKIDPDIFAEIMKPLGRSIMFPDIAVAIIGQQDVANCDTSHRDDRGVVRQCRLYEPDCDVHKLPELVHICGASTSPGYGEIISKTCVFGGVPHILIGDLKSTGNVRFCFEGDSGAFVYAKERRGKFIFAIAMVVGEITNTKGESLNPRQYQAFVLKNGLEYLSHLHNAEYCICL